ncbi:MAG: DNA polymerase ligase N-terminal domain-containing protein [Bacillota bacterium]|jgi:bifunctional non-homologous end joining protein LigD
MPLRHYQQKRDFDQTPEPSGDRVASQPATHFPRFVIQEHHARRLHWDLRLERDGVLKSWAVPKGIPLRPGIKRLAVQVEDHPLDYIDFSGTIPAGNYGAGEVFIWDKGHYAAAEYTDKKITLAMLGERVKGGYKLVHTDGNNWLLFKMSESS